MELTKIVSLNLLNYYDSKLKPWVEAKINQVVNALTFTKDKITDLTSLTSEADDADTGLWTGSDKKKLDNLSTLAEGAVSDVKVNGSSVVDTGVANIIVPTSLEGLDNSTTQYATTTEVDNKIAQAVAQAVTYKGSVDTVSQLPSNATNGDMYNVKEDDINRVWDGTQWDKYATIPFEEASNSDIDNLFT